jgi:hypothetical protein
MTTKEKTEYIRRAVRLATPYVLDVLDRQYAREFSQIAPAMAPEHGAACAFLEELLVAHSLLNTQRQERYLAIARGFTTL